VFGHFVIGVFLEPSEDFADLLERPGHARTTGNCFGAQEIVTLNMHAMLKLMLVLAAVFCTTVFGGPSASAHEGHSHHARAASESTAPTAVPNERVARSLAAVVHMVGHSDAGNSRTYCHCNCCGGASGMACCGAALAPELFHDPFVETSTSLYILPTLRLPGIPPEAPPKPPKSLA